MVCSRCEPLKRFLDMREEVRTQAGAFNQEVSLFRFQKTNRNSLIVISIAVRNNLARGGSDVLSMRYEAMATRHAALREVTRVPGRLAADGAVNVGVQRLAASPPSWRIAPDACSGDRVLIGQA
jgi:hypothetical protein